MASPPARPGPLPASSVLWANPRAFPISPLSGRLVTLWWGSLHRRVQRPLREDTL